MNLDPGAFQPLPLHDERAAAARAEAEAVLAQANKMYGEADSRAQRLVGDAASTRDRMLAEAQTDAQRIRDAATAETEQRKERDDKLDTWSARGIIAGTVGLTASGEYSLARMAGFDPQVAWLLPFVIDVYVIQAFRRHRDIIPAIALTVAANVTYHLADAGRFGVTPSREPKWWLIALVASVASFILWRIHLMVRPPKPVREGRQKARQDGRQEAPPAPTEQQPAVDNSAVNDDRQEPTTGDDKNRQEPPAEEPAPVAKRRTSRRRQNTGRKPAKKTAN
ncbi:hypothetical protein ACFVZ2_19010, partial [Streptomyces lasiicapitis]